MNIKTTFDAQKQADFVENYLDALSSVERLHRLLLGVIKDEFERLGHLELNAVQALLIFNIGENEVTAGELKTRGYYQESNVSSNLKKLVDMGYMHHHRCKIDRRALLVKLTLKRREICEAAVRLFADYADSSTTKKNLDCASVDDISPTLKRVERFWTDPIFYMY